MDKTLLYALLIGVPWIAVIAMFFNKAAIAKFLESLGASKVLDQVKEELQKASSNVDKEIENSKKREEEIKKSDVDLEWHNRRKP